MVNPFKIKLSRIFIIRSYLGILVSGLMYCILLPFILNLDLHSGIELARKVLITLTLLGLVCTALFYILYRPAENLILGIQKGITPVPEKIIKTRKSLSKMDSYYMVIGIVFYPLGTVINLLSDCLRSTPIIIDNYVCNHHL